MYMVIILCHCFIITLFFSTSEKPLSEIDQEVKKTWAATDRANGTNVQAHYYDDITPTF